MTIAQIITLIILGVLICIGYFGAAFKINYEKYGLSGFLYVGLITAIGLLTLSILAITLDSKHDLEKQLKSKCPEYERIENVYILKK
jgi:hypothetical protein